MRKSKIVQLAEERRVSVSDLLRELYDKHGNQTAVAAKIGISQSRLSQIIKEHGLSERVVLVEMLESAS